MLEVERREYLRIDCLVESYILNIEEDNELNYSAGLTKNISATGLLFKTKNEYKTGDILSIEISTGMLNELDENKAKVIKTRGFVLGKVARVEKVKEGTYDCAVIFIPSKEEDVNYLRLFQDLMNKALYF
jgi:c-di-GMP-binding flagellar brake protein YcgR